MKKNFCVTAGELIEVLKSYPKDIKISLLCQDSGGSYNEILSGCSVNETTIGNAPEDVNDNFSKLSEEEKILILS